MFRKDKCAFKLLGTEPYQVSLSHEFEIIEQRSGTTRVVQCQLWPKPEGALLNSGFERTEEPSTPCKTIYEAAGTYYLTSVAKESLKGTATEYRKGTDEKLTTAEALCEHIEYAD